jgi:hypothetical protein
MSYLDSPRITFAGRFLGDVPTMNNDPTGFGSTGQAPEPGWNARGGGTFDFLGCAVDGGETEPGVPMAAADPAIGLAVVATSDRSSAKLVDLDPDWQFSAQIWGLTVRLVGPAGEQLLSGRYRPAAFRDIWARRPGGVDFTTLGASFTSVLEDVEFGAAGSAYPVLTALRETSSSRLSIGLNVFGFSGRRGSDSFATGRLTGCIGAWRPGEPLSFVAGRRLEMGRLTPQVPFGRAVAVVSPDASRLVLDLGNAYPFADPSGAAHPQATTVGVGVLPAEEVQVGDVLTADAPLLEIGAVSLRPRLPPAGIVSFALAPGVADALTRRPLALFTTRPDGRRVVVSRETRDGLYVRADEFVHRIEAGTSATTTLYAVRRGEPAGHLTIHLAARAAESVLTVPDHVETGADGTATVTLTAADPRNPRGALDGVIENVEYGARLTPEGGLDTDGSGIDRFLDVIVAHVRDGHAPPADADLESDVRQLLAPYARHYPIMGEHLVDLGDLDAIRPWRAAMLLAMSRDITDPNHMPVTRDLSEPKRAAILRWLNGLPVEPGGMSRSVHAPGVRATARDAKTEAGRAVVERAMHQLDRHHAEPADGGD